MVMCYRFLLIPDVVQVWAVNITVMNIRAVWLVENDQLLDCRIRKKGCAPCSCWLAW